MGNEASLEGGEGSLVGLPEGLAPDGNGGFIWISTGAQVDLSQLSEDDRKQVAAAMSRAQTNKPGGVPARRPSEAGGQQRPQQPGADGRQRPQQPGVVPSGRLSKSRTVDAFGEGPTSRPVPGRSPSSLSLFESRFRQEPKDPEKKTGMFGSSFLSGANPLSAVSSMTSQVSSGVSSMSSEVSSLGSGVNMPSFGLFEKEEKPGEKTQSGKGPQHVGPRPPGPGQGPRNPGPQGPRPSGQGPPGQQGPRPPGQGPPGQQGPRPPGQQGPRPSGQGPPGQQGPRPSGQGPPGQQGPRPPGQGPPGQQGPRPSSQGPRPPSQGSPGQQGPPRQQGPRPSGSPHSPQGPGKPPGGGLCPLCKSTQLNVGSKEPPNYNNCTLCKNQVCSLCGFSPPDSAGKEWLCLNCQMQRAMGGMDDPPMMGRSSVPPSPTRKDPGKDGKKPSLLIKQQSISDKGLTPPTTPKQKSPGPSSPKGSPQPSPAKGKQESGFFGGLGGISLGGLTDVAKTPAAASQAAESITGTMFSGFGGFTGSAKPDQAKPTAAPQKTAESVAGKMFGGFGGFTETAKPPAAASQMFGFGSSILSSATNLMTADSVDEKTGSPVDSPAGSPPDSPFSAPGSPPGSPPDSPFSAPGSPPDSDCPDTPPASSKKAPKRAASLPKPQKSMSIESEPIAEPPKATEPAPATGMGGRESCPLCSVALNVGSADSPNYSTCTECKKIVCNLCGFNPTPQFGEKEWLCLNCQTQRALSGQLGEIPTPPSPVKKQLPTPVPTPPTSPAKVPVPPAATAAASPLTISSSVTQGEAAASAAKEDTQMVPESKVVLEPSPPQTPVALSANTDTTPIPSVHAAPSSDSGPEQTEPAEGIEPESNLDRCLPESVVESAVEIPAVDHQQEKVTEEQSTPDTTQAKSDSQPAVERPVTALSLENETEESFQLTPRPDTVECQAAAAERIHTSSAGAETEEPIIECSPDKCTEGLSPPDCTQAKFNSQPADEEEPVTAPPVETESEMYIEATPVPVTVQSEATTVESSPAPTASREPIPSAVTEEVAKPLDPEVVQSPVTQEAAVQPDQSPQPERSVPVVIEEEGKAKVTEVEPSQAPKAEDTAPTSPANEELETELQATTLGHDLMEEASVDTGLVAENIAVKTVVENKIELEPMSEVAPVPPADLVDNSASSPAAPIETIDSPASPKPAEPKYFPLQKHEMPLGSVVGEIAPVDAENERPKVVQIQQVEVVASAAESPPLVNDTVKKDRVEMTAQAEVKPLETEIPANKSVKEEPACSVAELETTGSESNVGRTESETVAESDLAVNAKKTVLPYPTELQSAEADRITPQEAVETPAVEQNPYDTETEAAADSESNKVIYLASVDIKDESEPAVYNEVEKAQVESTPRDPEAYKQEKVTKDQAELAVEALSPSSAAFSVEKPTPGEKDSEVPMPHSLAENKQEVSVAVNRKPTPTLSDEKAVQEELPKQDELEQTPKTDSLSESIQTAIDKVVLSPPVVSEEQESISVSEGTVMTDIEGSTEDKTRPEQITVSEIVSENVFKAPSPVVELDTLVKKVSIEDKTTPDTITISEIVSENVFEAPYPVVEPDTLVHVDREQNNEKSLNEEKSMPGTTEIKEAEVDPVEETTLKEPAEKDRTTKDSSPTSPSDLAKLESTVLPILEAQAVQPKDDSNKLTDTLKARRKLEVLPLSPESPSTEDDQELVEKTDASAPTKKKLLVPTDIMGDSLEDSSESFGKDSPMSGDDEDFIRKQIMEMSENEDASPSDEENLIRRKIRDQERKQMEQGKGGGKEKSSTAKGRRLLKKCTISPEDEDDKKLSLDDINVTREEESKPNISDSQEVEQPLVDSGMAVRKFRTIELNTTSAPVRIPGISDDGELEMESLTDSPDDRSKGDGSSSLHASSFTPGTSPTSLSSLDEDSDSSSPSRIHSGEGKQHRKAKHRQPGQVLPTIEDSSEEEELREEEELLKEQEKQKGSGKKSKKDKEEIRAQRRRERPKTPPSNLSPIEDASPTEELRQEAEMEEFRRSSLSDFSPSIESEPEGVEINAAKIAAVQKVYQLPTSVSLYSPTADQDGNKSPEKRALKTADEAYEEIMLKVKTPTNDNVEIPPGKESLYGGMLIEDYVYESLIEGNGKKVQQQEPEKISVPAQPKILRSPDEVYEDMMEKKKQLMQLEEELKKAQPVLERPTPEIVLQPAEPTSSVTSTVTIGKDGKTLLDAEAAYEELMKKILTPGTSPTQQDPHISGAASGGELEGTRSRRALHPIPDLRVTQCSSGEEDADEEAVVTVSQDEPKTSDVLKADQASSTAAAETEPEYVVCEFPQSTLDQPQSTVETSLADHPVVISQSDVMDLSSMTSSASVGASVSPLPTVPQYTSTVPSVVSTAPPVPPKPTVLRRALSQEKADVPEPPPLPPPTMPKPSVYPRKPPVPLPPQATIRSEPVAMLTSQGSPIRQPHVPPPVPPKPAIPAGMGYIHRPGENVKPPLAPKPASQPGSPAHVPYTRPTALHTGHADIALNLSPSSESRPGHFSGHSSGHPSPTSPRYGNRHNTYVVITLPSQPSSPVEGLTTQAPSSPGPASPSRHSQQPSNQPQIQYKPQSQPQPQQQPQPPPSHTNRVPLAFTRITESMESQEICGPESVVSSSCHVIEAISSSAPPPEVRLGQITQFVTTEVQRTMVSVRHERTPPPLPAPRANGVPISLEKTKPQPTQSTLGYQPEEVVDLRTMKVDSEYDMKGVDLSSSDVRRQSSVTDIGCRQTSAVQSPVVDLRTESSTVSIVTDSITIVTCAATIQRYENTDTSQVSSVPLQLTTNKAFEPVCQIVYRPIDTQPITSNNAEIPINLSVGIGTGIGTFQPPVTIAPTPAQGCVANGLSSGGMTVAGAVDLSTSKPFNTVVSVNTSSAEVITAVITEEDGKPVDLTAGRRTVCCDVVYQLPFAGSCTTQQPTTPLPEDRFGYRDDHYQYDRSPYGMRGFGGIKPSMSDTNLAEAGLFLYKSKNCYNFNGSTEGAVDLTSAKTSDAGVALDFSTKGSGAYSELIIPPYSQTRVTGAVGTHFGTTSVLRSSNGVVYSSVSAPIPSTYAITTQPGSIFSTTYNSLAGGMHTSDTMPSLSALQDHPMTRSHSFISTSSADDQGDVPLNLELSKDGGSTSAAVTLALERLDSYTDASLEAIAASLEALSSPCVPGDGQYQMQREILEMEKLKQQRLAEELEWERQEIQRFREQEQMLVQKELEELQSMKQAILCQQEEERQAHLMMQKETYAQQQQQLEQIQRLQEQLRAQLEEQKFRKMYPGDVLLGHGQQEAVILGPDGTELARKIMESGCQTDDEDNVVDKAYAAGRKKRSSTKKSVDSCVQTDDEDQEEWEPTRARRSRPRTSRGDRGGPTSDMSIQAHSEISIQTDSAGNIRMDARMELSDSESPHRGDKRRPTPLEIEKSDHLRAEPSSLQAPPKSPKVLYSPISPCISPSKSLEFVSYEKSLGDTSPQRIRGSTEPTKASPAGSPRAHKTMPRSLSDPKPMSPTAEEKASSSFQYGDGYSAKGSPGGTQTGTGKKVKRTLPNPPAEEESTTTGQTAYTTGSARRRMCRNTNMARAKILQDIDRELDMVERESSKLRHKQAELDEEEKEIDAKLRYLEMGINRRKDALLKEREKRERAYLQSVAEDRDYMSDSEVSNIRETRSGRCSGGDEEMGGHGLDRPRTAPQSELDDFVPPQTTHEAQYGKYSQYQYPQSQTLYQQQSLYQSPQSYQAQSIYSSVPSLSSTQQQSYHQMLLLQQKAARQAVLLQELDASSKYEVISRQPDPVSSAYIGGVRYDKYGNHLDLRALEVGDSIPGSPMSNASADSFYGDVDHHHTPRSYVLLEDAAELAKSSTSLASSSYAQAEKELAKAERLLRRSAADLTSTDYLGSSSRLHSGYGKTPDDEDSMDDPYELKLLKQQLKQEFRRSTGGTESLDPLTGLSHNYYGTPSSGVSTSQSYSQRHYPKTDKYSISRLTLEKQAAKQLPASMLYQKHKAPLIDPKVSKYSSMQDGRGLEADYTSYLGSSSVSASPRCSRLLQDEITFGLRKNIAEQQKYLGSTLGANLAGSLNFGQSLALDSAAYPSGSRSRPSSRPTSVYGLDLSIKRDPSNSSLRLKGDGEAPSDSYQTPTGRAKPTSLPIVQGGRGRIPIVAQNSEEESPLSPVGQPMGMARASAGPLPPISADSRDQFGSCLSLQDSQQQHLREEPTRGRGYVLMDDLQGTVSDGEALSDSMLALNRDDPLQSHENIPNAYHLRREETDWFDKPQEGRPENGHGSDRRQGKGVYYPFPHTRVKLRRDPKHRSVSGNGLGIRVVGGKEVPGTTGDIGAYVAKVLPGGAAEHTGKILEGMQVLEWNGLPLTGKTYEEVQGLVGQQAAEAELCVRLDLNMLSDSDSSQQLDLQNQSKAGERPPRSPGVDPQQLAAELQKVSQQQAPPLATSSSSTAGADKGPHPAISGTTSAASSAIQSPGQPGSPSVSKKRHSKSVDAVKTQSHPVTGEIQLQIHYDKQLGNLIVHVLQARNLATRDNNGFSDPFVKVYLLPGRGAENKRRSKHAGKSVNPEWNQTVIYKNIHLEQLRKKTLEVSVWDYDKCSSNDFLGEVLIDLSNTGNMDNVPRWLPLKEQSEGEHHRRSHSGQGRQHSPKQPSQHASPKNPAHGSQDSPKSSVIKSRSHGIFPDPAKDTQVPTIEKSHSSPGTSKPSPSEGHSQHTPRAAPRPAPRKSTRQHQQDGTGGVAIAIGEAPAPQQQHRLQPISYPPAQKRRLSLRHHRHSIVGVLTIQRAQSDSLPAPPGTAPSANGGRADGRHLTLRKAMSEERPRMEGARTGHRSGDAPVTAASLDSGLSGSAYSLLDDESGTNAVDSAIFQVPRFGKIPNGTNVAKSPMGHMDSEGKSQVMGEIKIALKKELKTEGDQLVLEVLQCRNITYRFKSPDHLPDLYVKLYVVNIATQKRIIKKKTRVCRHDREPSFNETFRFSMNPTGHSLQLFLVSNGGKFMKKTLIGEAYVWLDKVDLRKRVVSWHKLLASSAQIHS
ncbi:protein piccolo isoform X2 [Esox lucius]|uniref:protein piccolo isoform X2 n=1 Tax=Esox lucius TaxID=8010 RepID=UPI001476D02F|nr:protein piccolo isoform X2 [Esox lucius]